MHFHALVFMTSARSHFHFHYLDQQNFKCAKFDPQSCYLLHTRSVDLIFCDDENYFGSMNHLQSFRQILVANIYHAAATHVYLSLIIFSHF